MTHEMQAERECFMNKQNAGTFTKRILRGRESGVCVWDRERKEGCVCERAHVKDAQMSVSRTVAAPVKL